MNHDDESKHVTPQQQIAAVSPPANGAASASGNRRAAARVETQHHASVRLGTIRYTVELCDISQTGAQIRIRQGLIPKAGQLVQLEFMNRSTAEARVVRSSGAYVGLEFVEPLSDCIDGVHFDDLGSDYYRAVLRLQSDAT